MTRKSKKGLGRKESKVLRLRVPVDLLAHWESFIEANQEDGPEVLRQVMAQLANRPRPKVKDEVQHEEGKLTVDRVVDRAPKKAVKLMLTQSEYAAISKIAHDRECSIQFWIVSLIRAALTRGITVGGAELEALGSSNYELSAIGRNLNQIARRLNMGTGADTNKLALLAEHLLEKVDVHRREVHALVNACSHRWRIVDES
ncbi:MULTISPECIES: plasmid mobilization relaxosome protein MobC [unclassified Pseudoxanthomonas]|uniref:plasmid mobilization relaxosome protein MobC n=1 Tax=unclassified Pseudoxanthomonas TaxID=2645906 RepID=UPI00307D09EA